MCLVDVPRGLRVSEGPMPVWDFSGCALLDGNAAVDVAVVGDSLLTEAFAGRRQWLSLGEGGALRWLGEETRSMHVAADSLGCCSSDGEMYLRARGRYAGTMNIAQEGTMRVRVSRPGVLVLCAGDSLRGVVRQDFERTCRTAMSSAPIALPLGAEADSLPLITSRYSRWVFPSRPLEPVALMHAMSVIGADGEPTDSAATCCMSLAPAVETHAEDEEEPAITADGLAGLLEGVGIASGRGYVSLSFGQWDGPEVTVAVTDTYGRLYLDEMAVHPAGEVRVDVSGCPAGPYLIVISADAGGVPVVRKELITIY